ncbi:MAG: right-handed parallel beta-helix repeat-containing protein [Planctomycetota bacterium]|jgi:hypothetical protein
MKFMTTTFGVLLLCVLSTVLYGQTLPDGPYFGQEPPGLEPKVFAPGIISLPNRKDRQCRFSHDGNECFVTISAHTDYTRQINGKWTPFMEAPFEDAAALDMTPCLTFDDQTLFFISSRHLLDFDTDIYVTHRTADGWTVPAALPAPISNFAADWEPSITRDGVIYYSSYYQGWGNGMTDIWRVRPVNGEYLTPEHVTPLNSSVRDAGTCIAPDESWIMFHSERSGGYGSSDLYISYHGPDDSWTEPENLGAPINSEHSESMPVLSPDGKYLFFRRIIQGEEDIYWVDARSVLPDPNGPIENLSTGQRFGSIQLAFGYAQSGDIIIIKPGIYRENLTLDKDIILQSLDPNDPTYLGGTIIQGDANEPVLTLSNNSGACEIAGLTLRAGSVGIMGTATDATIRNCRIMDNATHGLELFETSSPYLVHCLITANGEIGIIMHATNDRQALNCEPVIEDCTIVDNGEAALVGGEPVIVDSLIQGQ